MKKNKYYWLWNIIIVLTVLACIGAFVLHYKNWSKFEEGHFQVVSGVYKQKINLSDISEIAYVERLPEMERKNGFSWLAKEKGVFKDSLTANTVYVFVDDLHQQKIRLIHNDSLKLYINFLDSLETKKVFEKLKNGMENENE